MTIFDYTPQAPDFRLRWEDITQAYEWVRALEPCPQDPRHHAEGNVWIHTRLVCEALIALPAWRMLEPEARDIVFAAALLHDVAKPRTTRQETDGSITARGHSLRGAVDARVLLWRMGVPFPAREQICGLIRHHQVPFFLLERPDPKRLVIQMSQYLRLDWLALVAEADMRGRVCADQARILDSVELFVEFCREEGSLDRPWPFASDRARFHYLQRGGRDPAYVPFDDTTCDVVLMSGFPGVGKDTWVSRNRAEWPVVSLDGLREELDVSPGEGQSAVVKEARERARVLLRRGESFVWNATNITRQIREACIALFADYRARVRIVYLETPEAILLKQNRDRTTSVPQQVIERLTQKWEVPDVTEADHVEWIVRPAT